MPRKRSTTPTEFGLALAEWMKERNLDRFEVADRLDYRPQYVLQILTGSAKPTEKFVHRFCYGYEEPEAKWLALAGITERRDERKPADTDEIRAVVREELRRAGILGDGPGQINIETGWERFWRRYQSYCLWARERSAQPLAPSYQGGPDSMTEAEADDAIDALYRQTEKHVLGGPSS